MISIIGHSHDSTHPHHLFIQKGSPTITRRKKSPLQMLARYFGL